jgi:UDP-glucose 4-epimerase
MPTSCFHAMRVELPCKAGLPVHFTNNLSTGKSTSIRSVISAVERVTGHAVPVVHAARRLGDPPVLVADASLACAC